MKPFVSAQKSNNMDVIYEDNHLLVVNKPAGILTQPSGTDQDSLEAQAKLYIKEKYQKPGNVFLGAVHRIDKPVSGLIIFARTSKALSRLQAAMREKKYTKIYQALVEGKLTPSEGTLEHYLIHDDYRATVATEKHSLAKFSRLHYKTLKIEKGISLLEIELDTGRYHQIRVQFADSGHPIIGDLKYGSKKSLSASNAIEIHHQSITFLHPVTGVEMVLKAPLPTYFKASG